MYSTLLRKIELGIGGGGWSENVFNRIFENI